MKYLNLVLALGLMAPAFAIASEDHGMLEVCKTECPTAQSEDEAHKCMEGVVKKKKNDKKFRKSDCFAAFKEHEKHEKEDGHKH